LPHSLDVLINDFAVRSLRETTDKDYVHARLAYRSRLIPQFLWSSLHCLEKYTKCILVLNRIDTQKMRHEVEAGLIKLQSYGKFQIDLSTRATTFVKRLEEGARFRYYEMSYFSEELDLPELDRTVWELRRYCQTIGLRLGSQWLPRESTRCKCCAHSRGATRWRKGNLHLRWLARDHS